ncbi:MAG: hypothetical protein FGM46_01165 [Ferruginibacter sp.]|nr:hypothetical protein [Ferruginibacter sp.]
MNKYFFIGITILLFSINIKSYSQAFTRGQQSHIQANQIITEQFFSITLLPVNNSSSELNIYNLHNPYTFIQAIQDAEGKMYQILYQTDFIGNLLYLGISNNLSDRFASPEKPLMKFTICLNKVNQSVFLSENIEMAIGCILSWLNFSD